MMAQEEQEIPLVLYTPDYSFRDGIYLNIDDVKAISYSMMTPWSGPW